MSENDELKGDVKWLHQIQESREIVRKILDFGVSQFQILKIIESLALEVEDRSVMLALTDAVRTAIDASEQQVKEKKELIL
jgi:hypothetical protein